jgi:hypothetical protein
MRWSDHFDNDREAGGEEPKPLVKCGHKDCEFNAKHYPESFKKYGCPEKKNDQD